MSTTTKTKRTFAVYYHVNSRDWDLETPFGKEALGTTHRKVREVTVECGSTEAGLEQVFMQMQGEVWSPNGEARAMIEELGLWHTSLSTGDVVLDDEGNVWTCMFVGWKKVETDALPFGPVIHRYTRAQAIDDGVLVDVTSLAKGYFKYSVAMTTEAYADVFGSGETADPGVAHDLFSVMILTTRAKRGDVSRIDFSLKVRGRIVRLYSVCGPGDGGEPVLTIMQPGQD